MCSVLVSGGSLIAPRLYLSAKYNNTILLAKRHHLRFWRVKFDPSESSAFLIHDVEALISYISQYITLKPGDVIFTGTPGKTQAMEVGDVIEIEVEGVGVLRNTITARE